MVQLIEGNLPSISQPTSEVLPRHTRRRGRCSHRPPGETEAPSPPPIAQTSEVSQSMTEKTSEVFSLFV